MPAVKLQLPMASRLAAAWRTARSIKRNEADVYRDPTLANCQFPSEALPVYCAIGFSIDDILNVLESISASEVSLIG